MNTNQILPQQRNAPERIILIATLLMLFSVSSTCWGWGNGHNDIQAGLLKALPKDISEFIGEANLKNFIKWGKIPDEKISWEEASIKYGLNAEEIRFMQAFNAKDTYSLHAHRKPGIQGNFVMLVRAFRDHDAKRASFWICCLSHTISDACASNHSSFIHYATYGFNYYKIKKENGIGFGFHPSVNTVEGRQEFTKILAEYKTKVVGSTYPEVFAKIALLNAECAALAAKKENDIMGTYSPTATKDDRTAGIKAMVELGAFGVCKASDLIYTAWNLAKTNEKATLDDQVFSAARKAENAYLNKAPLSDDSIYTGLIEAAAPGTASIGMLLERSRLMMASKLSFGGRVIMAGAMRQLKEANIPYHVIDLRNLQNRHVLNHQQTPILVLCAGPLSLTGSQKSAIKKYFADGGRILYIGGQDKGLLGDLSKSMLESKAHIFPVSQKYGCHNKDIISDIEIRFLPPFNSIVGNKPFKFINNPDTPAGSQKPLCRLVVEPLNENVIPLAELSLREQKVIIAAGLKDDEGKFRVIFLPEYLLAPFILSGTTASKIDIFNLKLDNVGEKLFAQSLLLLKEK